MKNKKIFIFLFALLSFGFFLIPSFCKAMPPGTLLYRTTDDGKMYGYTKDPLIETTLGVMRGINPGHVGIYVGQEEGIDYVVEALAGGIVKTKLEHFVNESLGEKLLGAKIPQNINPLQQARAVLLAKNLAASSFDYDFDFKKQKGPKSGQWTCVGLAEKIYESANISNPFNLDLLEYDESKYAVNITPDGFDDYSFFNQEGDCFSQDKEFSLIAPRTDIILPLPEKYGFNAGLIYRGDRYIFFPYTQYLQSGLKDVTIDKKISSNFDATKIRGGFKASGLVLRWSLINNPVSAVKIAWENVKEGSSSVFSGIKTAVAYASDKLFPDNKDKLIIASSNKNESAKSSNSSNYNVQEKAEEKTSTLSKMGGVTVASQALNTNKTKENSPANSSPNSTELSQTSNEKTLATIKESLASLINTASEQEIAADQNKASESPVNSPLLNKAPEIPKNKAPEIPKNEVTRNAESILPLKISKVYSTLNDDFIELYNPNNFSIDLLENSYRLERAKTGIDPSIMMRIGNLDDGSYPGGLIIPARGYYLIVKESASSYYLNLADAIASRSDFSLTGHDQTVYLGIGAISSYQDEDIVDVLGFGPGAKYYLGSSPAPKIEDYHFLNRIAYKNNNVLDYNLLLSAEPAAIAAWQAQNAQETEVTPPPVIPPPVTPPPVTPPPVTPPPVTPPPVIPPPVVEPPPVTPPPVTPPPDDPTPEGWTPSEREIELAMAQVLIKKIGVYENDDYIELFNYSNLDLDLAALNFRLEKSKTTLAPLILVRIGDLRDGTYPGGTIIPAGTSYLLVRDSADPRFLAIADAIVTRKDFNLFASGYSIYLGKGTISSSDDEDIIDLIGYGPESLYYSGTAPAPAIKDAFYLERFGFSANNYNDFALTRDEHYNLDGTEIDDELGEINDGAFIFPEVQTSIGMQHLWNFDDCYSELGGEAVVGKWACGRKYGFLPGDFSTELEPNLELSSFSIGFYYKPDYFWPRIDLIMNKVGGGELSLGVEPGYLTLQGIPGAGYFYLDTDFEDQWNYLTLVVDQVEGYWAVFSNGQQLVKKYFLARLPAVDSFSLSGGGGSMYFDDLAIWNRPLLKEEVQEIINNDAPFHPSQTRSPQLIPQLLYRWHFEEYGQSIAYDSQHNEALTLNSILWGGRDNNNYAIAVDHQKYAEVDFTTPFASQDLSLSFWWKNTSHPDEGRVTIDLLEKRGEEEIKKFGLSTDYYRQYYNFNNKLGMIAEGVDGAIPNDGKWHHLALIYDSYRYRLRFFVDAVEKTQIDLVRMRDAEELINSLRIYSDARSSAIDELMIFSGALRPLEVRYIYQTTKTEPWLHEDIWVSS